MTQADDTLDGIAIIAVHGRFPGAASAEEFWANLLAGRETVSWFQDDELRSAGLDPEELRRRGNYVAARGVLQDADKFDAAFFGIHAKEAEVIDPQQRVFLELCWEALERAGYAPGRINGPVGVYAGAALNTYYLHALHPRPDLRELIGEEQVMFGNEKDYLATRVAYKLDLSGPAIALNTACSSSLVCVVQAYQALMTYQCDMALAGGVSIMVPQQRGYYHQEGYIGSPDGHTRTFDVEASGTAFSNGATVVVLKRLADAVADGDNVIAVIKGVAVNNDGARRASFGAPSVDGQAEAITFAQEAAGFDPESVSYVEAHGTATPLGDPIEVAALTKSFRRGTQKRNFCAIGSVKSNFGHLDAAAGTAGLIKTALSLQNRKLPPSLHFRQANPKLELETSPFFVNAQLRDWTSDSGAPLRAGVSSFGSGGTNAHVVLEEAPPLPPSGPARDSQLLLLSAKSETALDAASEALAAHLEAHPDINLADVAHTLQTGRSEFTWRRAVVCDSHAQAAQLLRSRDAGTASGRQEYRSPPVVFMFPGQGSQFVGMGAALYKSEPVFRAAVDECADALQAIIGGDLRSIIFEAGTDAQAAADRLRQTRYTQPALFTINYSLAQLWISWGITPAAMIGHSVGEFVAACLAGVFSLQDGLKLVAERARLVQEVAPGAMLAVRASEADVLPLLGPDCTIAAINSARLCVASGPHASIAALEKTLAARGVTCRALHTSHAFHSPMMDPVLKPFASLVGSVTLSAPKIPYLSNVTGRWIRDEEAISPEYWASHVRQAVRFAEGVDELLSDPTRVLLEVGAGQTLTQLARQSPNAKGTQRIISSLGAMGDPEQPAALLALGRLWLNGSAPDWKQFHARGQRRRVVLPTYRFERKRYWPEPAESRIPSSVPAAVAAPSVPLPEIVVTTRIESLTDLVRTQLQELAGADFSGVEPNANFLEIGLDSLLLTQAATLLQRKFGVSVSFRQLMEEQNTFESLVQYLDQKLPAGAFAPIAAAPTASAASVASPALTALSSLPAGASGGAGSALDVLLQLHLQTTAQLISLVRGQVAGAAPPALPPAAIPAPAPAPAAAPALAAAAATAAPRTDSTRTAAPSAHGPFRPLDKNVSGGITAAQQALITALTNRYTKKTGGSKKLAAENRRVLADPRTVAGFKQAWKEIIYPIYTVKSEGSRVWDVDGNEYLDFVMGMGANLFGHRPAFVVEAAHRQLDIGFEIGPIQPLAGEVARLVRDITGMERVGFCNTGSEAVLAAVRVARTVTGRDKIVSFTGAYHGIFDEVLVRPLNVNGEASSAPIAPGIPMVSTSQNIVLEWGNPQSLEVIRRRGDEIAAVLVEPIQSRRLDLQPKEFLQELRRVTQETGSALVFDEVVNGFRVRPGGAQEYYGIRADIATYGKIIGGGFSLGVVAGSARFLDALDGGQWEYGDASFPEVGVTFFAGTFVRHPVCLAIAKAVLEHLKAEGPALQERVAALATDAAQRVRALVARYRVPIEIMQFSSLMGIIVKPEFKASGLLYALLRDQGIHTWENRTFVFTTAHNKADVDRLVAGFDNAFGELAAAGFILGAPPEQVTLQLTEPQREMLAAVQMDDEANCSYNLVHSLTFSGPLQQAALLEALRATVQRHEALRTTVDLDAETQIIHAQVAVDLPLVDLSTMPQAMRQRRMAELLDAETRKTFDLSAGPLFRAQLVREGAGRHHFILTAHHIVCDGWSTAVLFGDLGRAYSAAVTGQPVPQPAAASYTDYVTDETSAAAAALRGTDEDYWAQQYTESVPVLDLPLDHTRPGRKSYRGAREVLHIEPGLAQAVRKSGARSGGTMFVTLLAAFQVLVSRLSRQHDFVLGIPIAGQTLLDNGHLISHSVNTVPLRCQPADENDFASHLKSVRTAMGDAQAHQRLTFGSLVQRLRLERDPSRTPLVPITFNIDRIGAPFHFEGVKLEDLATPRRFVNFELAINAVDNGTDLLVECDYNTDLFDAPTIQRWLSHYRVLLESLAANPSQRLDELPLLTAEEQKTLLADWNRTDVTFAGDMRLHRLFEQQVARTPRAEALVCGTERLTYEEVNRRANRLAHQLRALGAGPDKLVSVCLHRTSDLIVSLLAVLKSGSAYVPLDPNYPPDRIAFMLKDSSSAVLITTSDVSALLPAHASATLCLDKNPAGAKFPQTDPPDGAGPANLAYVIYTSGSTGVPKGVAIEHRSTATLLHWARTVFTDAELGGMLASTSVCFDLSVFEIFLPLSFGGRIILADNALHLPELPARNEVTLVNTVPSAAAELLRMKGIPRAVTTVCLAGEPLPTHLVDLLYGTGSVQRVYDLYGPSEDTTYSTYTLRKAKEAATIGRPIANTRAYVLDARMNPVPVGVPGELFLGGDGLARGYLGREELTRERFLQDPFLPGVQNRIYRTGDLVRYRPDSQLAYLGRLDHQVKVRGFRIELGEVETALRDSKAVKDACVIVREDTPGDPRIVAYVVPSGAATPDLGEQLRTALRGRLPEYMVPSSILALESLPRTPNGKLDRKALPAPGPASHNAKQEMIAPRTPSEELVAHAFREVLNQTTVSVTSNFFDLGGHSLMAARLMARLRSETALDLPLRMLFERPTIAELASAVDAARWAASSKHTDPAHGAREEIEI